MNFSEALDTLKAGTPVRRKSWIRKDAFINVKMGDTLNTPRNKFDKIMTTDFIYLDVTGKNAKNHIAPIRTPWLPTYEDLFAEDWYIVK